jgi:hypothetical protein
MALKGVKRTSCSNNENAPKNAEGPNVSIEKIESYG